MGSEAVDALVAPLRAAVDRLLDARLSALGSAEVTELVRELETQRRRLSAVDHQVIAEMDQRGAAGEYARSGTADLPRTHAAGVAAGSHGPGPPGSGPHATHDADGRRRAGVAATVRRCDE